MIDDPAAIEGVHASAIEAGAEVIITASYQASFEGFRKRGLDDEAIRRLLADTVAVARRAVGGREVLVAASVGPYGAACADGSEYTGAYGVDRAFLEDWHAERLRVLSEARPDVLAVETLPSIVEAEALLSCLDRTPGPPAWFAFSTRDDAHVSDGTPLVEAVDRVHQHPRVAAVGVNCALPARVESLLRLARGRTPLPLVAYANSGEQWDAERRCWIGERDPHAYVEHARRWADVGARLIGGCCRTGPAHIRELVSAFR